MTSQIRKTTLELLPATSSKRRPPLNLSPEDLPLFEHEFAKEIPETQLLELKDVGISDDGILFRGENILTESFAFPANFKQWPGRSVLKFFVNNYFLRRKREVDYDVLWVTDDWSKGYFHWLTDVLTRIYVVRDRLDAFVLLLPSDYAGLDFVRSSLQYFGVKVVEFINPGEVLKCRRVFMPTHTAPSGHYNEEIIRGVRELLLKNSGYAGADRTDRIYLSRRRAPKRRIVNEEQVEQVMMEFGFRTVYSEDLTFEEQIRTFSRCGYLVSNHGAGMTNMLFMPDGAGVLELRHEADSINNCYFTLASALSHNYYYQSCAGPGGQDPHLADLVVDAVTLQRNLRLLLQP